MGQIVYGVVYKQFNPIKGLIQDRVEYQPPPIVANETIAITSAPMTVATAIGHTTYTATTNMAFLVLLIIFILLLRIHTNPLHLEEVDLDIVY